LAKRQSIYKLELLFYFFVVTGVKASKNNSFDFKHKRRTGEKQVGYSKK